MTHVLHTNSRCNEKQQVHAKYMAKYMARDHAKSGRKLGRIDTHYISTTYDGKPLRNLMHKCQDIMIETTNYSKKI